MVELVDVLIGFLCLLSFCVNKCQNYFNRCLCWSRAAFFPEVYSNFADVCTVHGVVGRTMVLAVLFR